MLFAALRDTMRTLTTPYFLRMLFLSVAVAAVIFALVAFGMGTFLSIAQFTAYPWSETLIHVLAGVGTLIFAWFFFPAVVPLIGVIFLENVATYIERQEYAVGEVRALPFGGEVMHALRFTLIALALNLLCLPLYLTVILAPFVYYPLNGYLLGREFFELAAARHVGRREARQLRKRYGANVFFAGILIVIMGTLPILNLFSPFIGAALMVHLFRRIEGKKRPAANEQTLVTQD